MYLNLPRKKRSLLLLRKRKMIRMRKLKKNLDITIAMMNMMNSLIELNLIPSVQDLK